MPLKKQLRQFGKGWMSFLDSVESIYGARWFTNQKHLLGHLIFPADLAMINEITNKINK